jgi:hypothetical protein
MHVSHPPSLHADHSPSSHILITRRLHILITDRPDMPIIRRHSMPITHRPYILTACCPHILSIPRSKMPSSSSLASPVSPQNMEIAACTLRQYYPTPQELLLTLVSLVFIYSAGLRKCCAFLPYLSDFATSAPQSRISSQQRPKILFIFFSIFLVLIHAFHLTENYSRTCTMFRHLYRHSTLRLQVGLGSH